MGDGARRAWRRLAHWWREWQAPVDEQSPWVARQVRDNSARLEAIEAQLGATQAQLAALSEGIIRTYAAARKPVPAELAVDAATQPMLRVVS
jgi:hypothetical protein